ncbi:MAG: alpha/beta fold hydrolase [Pseudomonadota bacterium]
MPHAQVNGVEIAYEFHEAGDATPFVLIQGLSMPLNAWPPAFIEALTTAGHPVLVMDNRDIGHSQTFDDFGIPNLAWQMVKSRIGLPVRTAYSLPDMGRDVNALMAHIGIRRAHIVGVSMGGMIAQTLALNFPQRCFSLTSIMSTTGNRRLPQARKDVLRHLMSRPRMQGVDERIAHSMKMWGLISSKDQGVDFDYLEKRIRSMYERGITAGGAARQMLAIGTADSRKRALGKLQVPTLVIHGKEDPLVPPAHGVDTAEAIPGARLELIDGMAHDLAPNLIPVLIGLILAHTADVERSDTAAA